MGIPIDIFFFTPQPITFFERFMIDRIFLDEDPCGWITINNMNMAWN